MLSVREREIILQGIWKNQKVNSQNLLTRSGKKLEVLYHGINNLDGGPDFKDAIIKISGILLKGDIELHLEDSGWTAHKHHTDRKYNRVVLHVVAGYSSSEYFIEREDGVKVEQLCVPISDDEISFWNRGNKKSVAKSESLRIVEDCPLSKCSRDKIWATIEAAGFERFFDKVEQISETRLNRVWDQILYEKTLEALGYSKNQKPFRLLAQIVPFELVRAEMQWVTEDTADLRCAALLFGAAGLLPSEEEALIFDSQTRAYIDNLKSLWNEIARRLNLKPMRQEDWQFFRLRPQNFPTRRIAGAVRLLTRFAREGLLEKLIKIVNANSREWHKIQSELENLFCQKSYGFWKSHYTFASTFSSLKQSNKDLLIGKNRSRDIVINIVLPVLYSYALEAEDKKLKTIVFEMQKRYSSSESNSIIKNMKSQLFEKESKFEKRRNIKYAYQQQGLIQLNKLYCNNMECERCLQLHEVGF